MHDSTATRRRRSVVMAGAALALAAVLTAGCEGEDSSATGSEAGSAGKPTPAGADTIRERIVDHTVTGTMGAESNYSEYYAPDGTVHGPSYEARWTIEDDRFCLDYDESPQIDCYRVLIDGDTVEWYRQDELQGSGEIAEGNPNNF